MHAELRMRRGLGMCAAAAIWLNAAAPAQSPLPEAQARLLIEALGFSTGEVRDLVGGQAIARSREGKDATEIATAGAILISAPPERLLAAFDRIDTERRAPGVGAIGVFGEPPTIEDLADLVLTSQELASLRRCQPGDCELKLADSAIRRFQQDVDWTSSLAGVQASAIMRAELFAGLLAYRREGYGALGVAHDKRPPQDLAAELASVLEGERWLDAYAPDVVSYLSATPGSQAGVTDRYYWTRVEFGLKPTIRLSHTSLHGPLTTPAGRAHVVATRQLFASHYLRGGTEVRLIFPRDGGGFLLVMTARSRNDDLAGVLRWVTRTSVRRRARDGMARYLQHVRRVVEEGRRGEVVGDP
jgi:hypothetical protein